MQCAGRAATLRVGGLAPSAAGGGADGGGDARRLGAPPRGGRRGCPRAGSARRASALSKTGTYVRKPTGGSDGTGSEAASSCIRRADPSEDQTSSFVRTRSITSVNSVVPAWPPRSGVLTPAPPSRAPTRRSPARRARPLGRLWRDRPRAEARLRRQGSSPAGWRGPCPTGPARCRGAPRPSRPSCRSSRRRRAARTRRRRSSRTSAGRDPRGSRRRG